MEIEVGEQLTFRGVLRIQRVADHPGGSAAKKREKKSH